MESVLRAEWQCRTLTRVYDEVSPLSTIRQTWFSDTEPTEFCSPRRPNPPYAIVTSGRGPLSFVLACADGAKSRSAEIEGVYKVSPTPEPGTTAEGSSTCH